MIQNVKKILAPIDFSEHSMNAMRSAMEIAKDVGAEVHLVHVIAPHHHFIHCPGDQCRAEPRLAREAAMIEQAKKNSQHQEGRIWRFEEGPYVRRGRASGSETGRLRERAVNRLIVMATHGRSGIEHAVLGGTTEKLVRSAPCSVLVIRARQQ